MNRRCRDSISFRTISMPYSDDPQTSQTGAGRQDLYAFGPYVFEPSSGDLRAPESRTRRLQQQPARLLEHFLVNPGELVSREEIREVLWADTKVEYDQGINFCVLLGFGLWLWMSSPVGWFVLAGLVAVGLTLGWGWITGWPPHREPHRPARLRVHRTHASPPCRAERSPGGRTPPPGCRCDPRSP